MTDHIVDMSSRLNPVRPAPSVYELERRIAYLEKVVDVLRDGIRKAAASAEKGQTPNE